MSNRRGEKHDESKPRTELVPPGTLLRIGGVMTECLTREKPYREGSWRHVYPVSRWVGALYRHMEAIQSGEDIDKDSGLPHIDHVLTCASVLAWHHAQGNPIASSEYEEGAKLPDEKTDSDRSRLSSFVSTSDG